MIQGFAFQVNNFENTQNKVAMNNNKKSTDKNFNEILDSKNKARESATSSKVEDKTQKNGNEFINNQKAALNSRKIDIKQEELSKKDENKAKVIEEVVSKEEETLEKLVEDLSEILVVFQNVIGLNTVDLEGIDLEDINLEVSVEELENLKVSLENLIDTVDLGEANSQIRETILNIDKMISDVTKNGEIEIDAEKFVLELKDVMETIESQVNKSDNKALFKEIESSSEKLQNLVDVLKNTKETKTTEDTKPKEDTKDMRILVDKSVTDKNTDLIDEELIEVDSKKEPDAKTEIKIKIVTEKKEGINLFNAFGNIKKMDLDVENVEESTLNIEKIPINIIAPIENQVKPINTTAINVVKNSEVLNPQQFMNIDKTDVIKQITSKVKTDYQAELNEIKIRLTPEHLGELTIKISLERGILSARALVENSNIKQLLETNINELKDNLKEQGIKLDSIDVSVGEDRNFEEKRPNLFMNSKNSRRLKTDTDNPVSANYYEDLNENTNSSSLDVGEGSMDITI